MRHARRLGEGITRLVPATPTVTLNRIQSGAGHLDLALVRSRNDAAFSLACAYELGNDTEGVVRVGGDLSAPPGELLPLLRMRDHPEGETLNIDLRQVTHLRRALLFAYSPAGNPLEPEGLLTFTTYGGARIELPVSGAHRAGCLAIATIYNVFGELVIRAEMEHFEGSAQVVTEAFGYERWISTASGSASASPGPPPPPQD